MCKTSEALRPRVEKSVEEIVMKKFAIEKKMNLARRCGKGGALLLTIAGLCGCAGNANETATTSNNNATLPVIVSGTPRHDAEVFRETDRRLKGADYRAIEGQGPNPVWDRE